MKYAQLASVSIFTSLFVLGCAGVQKDLDKHFAKKAVGQKYSEMTDTSGFKVRVDYGEVVASESLGGDSTLYVHVREYESESSTAIGIWGSRTYSYKIFGFKVRDDVVEDWAYGLFTPQETAGVIFGFEYGYDHEAAMEAVKKDYPNLIRTSTEKPIAIWKK